MIMLEMALSVLLIASIIFLIYELRKFRVLHARKYEMPTEKIWEKFVGIRPEEMEESNLTVKIQNIDKKIDHFKGELQNQKKIIKRLVEELGK